MNKIFKILAFLMLMMSLFILTVSAVILVKVASKYTTSAQTGPAQISSIAPAQSSTDQNSTGASVTPQANSTALKQPTVNNGNTKTFTLAELKKYNGKNGNPAYVAVNGKVYDVTGNRKWRNGTHAGYPAGVDLSKDMNISPHGLSVLNGLTIVGNLVG